MAEVLVRVVDKIHPDFYLNLQCTKRGDVIVACPDGWNWGTQELLNPDWRIVKIPGLTVEDAIQLTYPDPRANLTPRPATWLRRAVKLDLDALPLDFKIFEQDVTRAKPTIKLVGQGQKSDPKEVELAKPILDFVVTKTLVSDPGILGAPDDGIIG